MEGKYQRQGVSLLILTITIIVILIIASISIVNMNNAISDTRMTSFSEELANIEDQVKIYYVQNNEFPVIDNTSVMSEQGLFDLASLDDNYKSALQNELVLNGDKSDNIQNGEFYQIDLMKLDLQNVKKGTKQDNDQNDVFVVAYPTMNVYYLKGEKINNEIYFSLSSKLTGIVGLDNIERDTSLTTVQKINGLIVTSNKKSLTNKLGINIQALLEADENLFMSFSGIEEQKEMQTIIGLNNFKFDTLDEMKSVITISDTEIQSFNNFDGNKYIDIIKKKNGVNVGTIRIDLDKFDNVEPSITENISIEAREQDNIAFFKVQDSGGSGIKEIKYDYLTRFDNSGNIIPYYENTTNFDVSYLKAQGKRINPASDGSVQIILPKEVESIQILLEDNAGNTKLYTQYTRPDIYVGIVPKSMSDGNATFNLVIDSINGISLVNTYISLDGTNYVNLQDYYSTSYTNKVVIPCDRYTGIETDKNYVYIKAIVKDKKADVSKRKTEVRVVRFTKDSGIIAKVNSPSLSQGLTPIKFDVNGNVSDTIATDTTWYSYVDTTYSGNVSQWANARTADGSQWVWIPRYAYKIVRGYHSDNAGIIEVKFLEGNTNKFLDGTGEAISNPDQITYTNGTQNEWLVHPVFTNNINNGGWDSELTGIWVAKYEAGFEEIGTAIDSNVSYSGDCNTYLSTSTFGGAKNYYGVVTSGTTKIKYPSFKANRYSYSAINIGSAYSISKALSDAGNPYGIAQTSYPHLMKTTEYGAVSYLSYSKYGRNKQKTTLNSTNANISDKAVHAVTAGGNGTNAKATNEQTAILNNKLQSSTGNVYGIYDLVGGVWEEQASYISDYGNSLNTYGANLLNDGGQATSTKYKLVYSNGYSNKIKGDGTYEISGASTTDTDSTNSWFKNYSVFPSNAYPLFYFSGMFSSNTSAGIFAFHHDTGLSSYGTGFRVALVP